MPGITRTTRPLTITVNDPRSLADVRRMYSDCNVKEIILYKQRDAKAIAWASYSFEYSAWDGPTTITTPIVSDVCPACKKRVDLFNDQYSLVRVNGNSIYGYEPCCLEH